MIFDYKAKFQLEDSELNVAIEIAKEVAAEIVKPVAEKQVAVDIIKPIALDDKLEEIMTNLKEFRLQRSRQENIKAYCIFSNEEMKNLIEASPKNKEELMRLKGFAEIKYQKYGEDIIKTISGK